MGFNAQGSKHKAGVSSYRKARPDAVKRAEKLKPKQEDGFMEHIKKEWEKSAIRTKQILRMKNGK